MAFDCQMLQLMDGHEPVAITRSLRFCLYASGETRLVVR
jgi:hypothetical protein